MKNSLNQRESVPSFRAPKGRENLAIRTEVRKFTRSPRYATSHYALVPRLDTNRMRAGRDEGWAGLLRAARTESPLLPLLGEVPA